MPDIAAGHLMLDIETWGVGSKAVIVEIGAVVFDPHGPLLPDHFDTTQCFYSFIDPDSSLALGFEVDAKTLMWWMGQDELTRQRLIQQYEKRLGDPVHTALTKFQAFYTNKAVKYVWAHGASFDPVLLTEYYRRLRRDPPFGFRDIRDTRTLYALMADYFTELKWKYIMRRDAKHHPVHDAWAQARGVQACLAAEESDETVTTESVPG